MRAVLRERQIPSSLTTRIIAGLLVCWIVVCIYSFASLTWPSESSALSFAARLDASDDMSLVNADDRQIDLRREQFKIGKADTRVARKHRRPSAPTINVFPRSVTAWRLTAPCSLCSEQHCVSWRNGD